MTEQLFAGAMVTVMMLIAWRGLYLLKQWAIDLEVRLARVGLEVDRLNEEVFGEVDCEEDHEEAAIEPECKVCNGTEFDYIPIGPLCHQEVRFKCIKCGLTWDYEEVYG